MLEGEFPDMAALERAMKQLQGNERYTQLLHSIDARDVAEEVLVAVDAPRPGGSDEREPAE